MEKIEPKVLPFSGTYMSFFDRIKVSHLCCRPLVPFAYYLPNLDILVIQTLDRSCILVEKPPFSAGILYEKIGRLYRGKIIGIQINNISKSPHRARLFRRLKWQIHEVVSLLTPDLILAFGNEAASVVDFINDNRHIVVRFSRA